MYDPEYLRLARSLCDRFEVHLIRDAIAVVFDRTGTFVARERSGIRPDFLCLSSLLQCDDRRRLVRPQRLLAFFVIPVLQEVSLHLWMRGKEY